MKVSFLNQTTSPFNTYMSICMMEIKIVLDKGFCRFFVQLPVKRTNYFKLFCLNDF